jgi:hypothetical protein
MATGVARLSNIWLFNCAFHTAKIANYSGLDNFSRHTGLLIVNIDTRQALSKRFGEGKSSQAEVLTIRREWTRRVLWKQTLTASINRRKSSLFNVHKMG